MKFNFFSEDDDVPLPKYIVRRESIGYSSRKVWTVRERNGENKLVTVMRSKNEATGWIEKQCSYIGNRRHYC